MAANFEKAKMGALTEGWSPTIRNSIAHAKHSLDLASDTAEFVDLMKSLRISFDDFESCLGKILNVGIVVSTILMARVRALVIVNNAVKLSQRLAA